MSNISTNTLDQICCIIISNIQDIIQSVNYIFYFNSVISIVRGVVPMLSVQNVENVQK